MAGPAGRLLAGACLLLGSVLAAPSAYAGAVATESAAQRIGWNAHRGVTLGTGLEEAADRLGTSVQTVPCDGSDFVYTGSTGDGVWLDEGLRDNGRVNTISTLDRRVVGPWGVRVGMRTRQAERRVAVHDRVLRHRRVWNPSSERSTHYSWVRGPRGHVLRLVRSEGRVASVALVSDLRLLRRQMRPGVDC